MPINFCCVFVTVWSCYYERVLKTTNKNWVKQQQKSDFTVDIKSEEVQQSNVCGSVNYLVSLFVCTALYQQHKKVRTLYPKLHH